MKSETHASRLTPHAFSDSNLIDKICDQLSPEAAALVLDLARGMTASGWDESGDVMRAQNNLERRLGKTVVVEGGEDFKRLIADCTGDIKT